MPIIAGKSIYDIGYSPWPSQERFHKIDARYKGFSSSVGAGKSLALVHEAIKLSVRNPGLLGLLGAPTYPMLRDITQRALFEVLDENEIPYEFHKQENRLTLTEIGSEIIFRSLDNPERLRGTNLAWFGVDELTYCQEAAWTRLEARLRHPEAKHLCGFAAWTPMGYDWVYKRFVGPASKPDYVTILAKPFENKSLPGDFYKRLWQSYDERFAKQEVLGEYLPVNTGRAYYSFDRTEHVADIDWRPDLPFVWSLDFNVNPGCSIIGQIIPGLVDELNILDEVIIPNSNTAQVCEAFAQKMEKFTRSGRTAIVYVYGDAAGSQRRSSASETDWQIVRNFFSRNSYRFRGSFRVPRANPPVKDRVNSVNALLRNGDGDIRLTIHKRCEYLRDDLEQCAWKQDAHGNVLGDLDTSDPLRKHTSDALGYLVYEQFKPLTMRGGPRANLII